MANLCDCPICNTKKCTIEITNGYELYSCSNCGNFKMPNIEHSRIQKLSREQRGNLSGYILEHNDSIGKTVEISDDSIDDILNNPCIANTLTEKVDKLLLYAYNNQREYGEKIKLPRNPARLYVDSDTNWMFIHNMARGKNYIQSHSIDNDGVEINLTGNGLIRCDELRKQTKFTESNSVFVAMWFDSQMDEAYEKIKSAIEDKDCGQLKPFCLKEYQHNNDITDEIIAGIRRCKFMVADLTGDRGGVYYEAGFARGLGKQVILTCKTGKGIKKPHFDVNHINIIFWKNEEELKKLLIDRIKATIH